MTQRKKPFSGKAKKQQMKDKRERNRARAAQDSNSDNDKDDAVNAPLAPPVPVSSGRGDLRTVFELEPKHVVELRKKDATRPLQYADDRGNSQSIYAYGIHEPANQPAILVKPHWTRQMTPEELIEVEEQAYQEWITQLKDEEQQREDNAKLNLFERNIEVWRQLWRVIERSSVLIHLADSRCPLLHISDQLMNHVQTAFPHKRVMIVLTKADLVAKNRVEQWVAFLQARYGDIPVLAYSREDMDESNAILMRTVGRLSAGLQSPVDAGFVEDEHTTLTIGFVGEPNVGKSSLLNSLFQRKLVSVSATPGHTKHLQTHLFGRVELLERGSDIQRLVVCDCPGVVFPRFGVPLALQILFGSFPIAQTREMMSPVRFIAENCVPPLDEQYKLQKVEEDDPDWSAFTLCESYAKQRGFHVKGGRFDVNRAANMLLRDTLNGKKVVLSFPPPEESTG